MQSAQHHAPKIERNYRLIEERKCTFLVRETSGIEMPAPKQV